MDRLTAPINQTHQDQQMRNLTLDEKITIKGDLKRQGVLPPLLVGLNMRDAIRLYWVCFGKPVAEFGNPDSWRNPPRKALESLAAAS
jgi:hypothetical protein